MEKQFVPYELAVKLKKLGFDEPCLTSYGLWQNPTKMEPDLQHTIPTGTYTRWSPIPFYGKYSHRSKGIVKAPLWQQALSWFRENHGLLVVPVEYESEWYFEMYKMGLGHHMKDCDTKKTYEEARQACLEKLIEIIENG